MREGRSEGGRGSEGVKRWGGVREGGREGGEVRVRVRGEENGGGGKERREKSRGQHHRKEAEEEGNLHNVH